MALHYNSLFASAVRESRVSSTCDASIMTGGSVGVLLPLPVELTLFSTSRTISGPRAWMK